MAYFSKEKEYADQIWYWFLVGDENSIPAKIRRVLVIIQGLHHLLPAQKRCVQCEAPLSGAGTLITSGLFGVRPSVLTPHLCNSCENMIMNAEGGAELELSMLFADIRGSTSKAQRMLPVEYRKFIQRFYKASSEVLIQHGALVNRLVGDQIIGLFVPRLVGMDHAKTAIEAAFGILKATGHEEKDGPWAPTGIGVHTHAAYVGAVGSKEGVNEVAVLGDAANLTARLSSSAAKGEVLISEEAAQAAHIVYDLEKRRLKLNGIIEPVKVNVIKVGPQR
jgi:adenylate cyclase